MTNLDNDDLYKTEHNASILRIIESFKKVQDEIEQLRVDYNEALIDGAANERAKVIAWLQDKGAVAFAYEARKAYNSSATAIKEGAHLE